jgi:Flp pilus assembly pilin Flp
MLRNFLKNKKGQHFAEYALLIALVVAAIIAMQTYAERAMQARIHDAGMYMANATSFTDSNGDKMGNETQYEPYYMQSNYDVKTNSTENERLGKDLVAQDSANLRYRLGSENTVFNGQTGGGNEDQM